MKLSRWSIATRLAIGFGAILSLFVALIAIGLQSNSRIDTDMAVIATTFEKVAHGTAIGEAAQENMQLVAEMMLDQNPAALQKIAAKLETNRQRNAATFERLDKLSFGAEGQALYDALKVARKAFIDKRNGVIALLRQGKLAEGQERFQNVLQPAVGDYKAALAAFNGHQKKVVDAGISGIEERNRNNRWLMLVAAAFGIALSALGATLIVRSITRPLGDAVTVADAVAKGDLTTRIEVQSSDETGRLLAALRSMNGSLSEVVGRVREASTSIGGASSQIAAGNLDLSSRTEEQASRLQETAASMEQLTSTVRQNGDHARQANQLAASASDVAAKGGEVVSRIVATMNEIDASSKRIADITGVIDSIAFQTNILALNAAVEAARAGEQGRGFAVVASEVRSLAQKSADAAKEIKTLIEDSVAKVDQGAALVNGAGKTMDEVVVAVTKVTDIMRQISAASVEQTSGIEQVNTAITQMDHATQQNAALIEESAAAAQAMADQVQGLIRAVSIFTLAEAPAAS